MFVSARSRLTLFGVVSFIMTLFSTIAPVSAQATNSSGCQVLLNTATQTSISANSAGPAAEAFNAGEVFTVTVTQPPLGTATGFSLTIDGNTLNAGIGGTITYTIPTTGNYPWLILVAPGPGVIDLGCTPLPGAAANEDVDEDDGPYFGDGRINDYDTANPIVVYPYQNEITGDGFDVYTDTGISVLLITGDLIAEIGVNEEENTLLGSVPELGIEAYRLTTGEFQVQAPMPNGKLYVLIFNEPYAGIGHTSFEIEF